MEIVELESRIMKISLFTFILMPCAKFIVLRYFNKYFDRETNPMLPIML